MFNNIFWKSCRLWDNVEKQGRVGQASDNIVRRMRITWCKYTPSYWFSTATVVTRTSVSRYTYITYLVDECVWQAVCLCCMRVRSFYSYCYRPLTQWRNTWLMLVWKERRRQRWLFLQRKYSLSVRSIDCRWGSATGSEEMLLSTLSKYGKTASFSVLMLQSSSS
jgi:hypothetical protein